jgi:ceramide glucosyltransferase
MVGLIAYGFQVWSIRATLKRKSTGTGKGQNRLSAYAPHTEFLPGISVLKPLKGLDDNLFDNLESICRQDYADYEIIFSLQDYNDPAYKVARKIKDKYRDRDITIIVEKSQNGLNPKVNNLIPAYRIAKYGLILISDSNVLVDRTYLREIVQHMEDHTTGLVSNVIQGTGGRTLGAVFENLHLNSFIMGSVCFLDKCLNMPCVVGKSMLMRKSDLEAIGGFREVKDVLAEDYIIGKRMHQMGKKVILSKHLIRNVNEYWGIRRFLNRHTRWGKLRWKIGGIRYVSEVLGNPVFMSCVPLIAWQTSIISVFFALTVGSVKIIGDLYIGRLIKRRDDTLQSLQKKTSDSRTLPLHPCWYFLSPLKDIIIGILWFVPLISDTVVWRGNRYTIGKDSRLSPCPESGFWAWRYRFADSIRARFA